MSAKTETIHVRISSGVRVWQVLLVAAALAACLFLGLVIGRASAPTGAGDALRYGHTAHVPAGG